MGHLLLRPRLLLVLLIGNNVSNYGSTAAAAILLAQTGMSTSRAELLTALLAEVAALRAVDVAETEPAAVYQAEVPVP